MAARGTLVTSAGAGAPALRRMQVVVAAGPDEGRALTLGDATAIVGTHEECSLRLSDPRVSRRHCELRVAADGVRVVDLGSKNGVKHNGAKIEAAVLSPGASIVLGDTELRFDAVDEELPAMTADSFGALTTKSDAMRAVLGIIKAVAPLETTVLLEGETGTGKEVLAHEIHRASARKNGPFLVVDCGSVAPSLVQSELFGHKKGAFTGAVNDHEGIFEAAEGGTVLIDEVGELPLGLQPALLRVLETRAVRRVGDAKPREIDVRIIAATNRALSEEVVAGRFRSDLYYRLAVVRASLPPLRERREDLPALVDAILGELRARARPSLAELQAHSWPGNIRELRNALEAFAATGALPKLVDVKPPKPPLATGTLRDERVEFERAYLVALLDAVKGNVSEAARRAGVDRNHIHRLIKKHGLRA
jgi:DNA-binding NtrC family response regulator